MKNIILTGLLLFGLNACTTNEMARIYGGTQTIDVPCNQKVINVTWKETDIWYLTRPMRSDEIAETFSFKEKSTYGVAEGNVVLKECKR